MHYNNTKSAIRNIFIPEEVKARLLEAVAKDEENFNKPTRDQILAIKDNSKRQKAISENIELFSNDYVEDRNYLKNTIEAIKHAGISQFDKDKLFEEVNRDEENFPVITKEEILSIQDSLERQKAISENIHLFK
ncbi:hypothetical protein ETI08_03845 [Macrococcoides goetzii]|nr:hypothetical protein [Macrococcus goetzii]TDM48284.1 hypothetical protein ETI08_03845 [Macrococcus goetzii]